MDTLTSVDIQEIIEIGGKVIEFFEGVFYRENFRKSTFGKVIDNFSLGQKHKDEKNDVMQLLVNFF